MQSAAIQPQSQPVDFQAGLEAMILAILQQTSASLKAQQAQMLGMQADYVNAQDRSVSSSQMTSLYAAYLADALAANSNLTLAVKTQLLHISSSPSPLPVSPFSSCVLLNIDPVSIESCTVVYKVLSHWLVVYARSARTAAQLSCFSRPGSGQSHLHKYVHKEQNLLT